MTRGEASASSSYDGRPGVTFSGPMGCQAAARETYMMLLLYEPPKDDPFINRAVAWIDGPYSHIELVFADGTASSIYAGETVFMHYRRFANPNYTTVGITASAEQVARARKYCSDATASFVGFDDVGMYTSRLSQPIKSMCRGVWGTCSAISRLFLYRGHQQKQNVEVTFCSKYVTCALQYAGIVGFERLDANATSPSQLYRFVSALAQEKGINNRISTLLTVTPFRRDLLLDPNTSVSIC